MAKPVSWRYFYFKNGGVVAQMRRIASLNGAVPTGGADAFLADFLAHAGVAEAVVSSFSDSNGMERHGHIIARDYAKDGLTVRLRNLFQLPRDILAARPDRILCGRQGLALMSCLAAGRLLGAPVVFSGHNRIIDKCGARAKLRSALDGWLIRRCHSAVCHGPYLAKELTDIGVPKARIHVFDSDCGDLMASHPAKLPPRDAGTERRILFVGRVVRLKGIFDLLDAFSALCAQGSNARLIYAGNGPHLDELQVAVQDKGLGKMVDFTGRLTYRQVGDEIQRSWAVVTPTRSEFPEGRCMAAMEALALGVPLIAPDAGPFPFLVKDKVNGLLFRQDSVEDLQAALTAIVSDPGLRQRLAQGAVDSSEAFRKAEVTFSQAVLNAFAGSART
jgi:glycosyltransferase involved in cell wall biosynthesis